MPIAPPASATAAREVSGCMLLVAVMMLFAAGKAVLYDTMDPDFFWHIRVAEQLHRDGIRPLVDQLSFTSIKTPWTPYSWLGELGMKWLWDHTGLRGAIAMQAILQAAFILLVALCCLQRPHRNDDDDEPLLPIILATAVAVFLAMPYLSFRPVLAAIDLLALITLLLLRDRRLGERSRAVWFLPILLAITVNLHIFAFFVPLWVGALMVGDWIERRVPPKRYIVLLTFCVIACCATPMLPGTLAAIRDYAATNPLTSTSMIAELEPMYRDPGKQMCLGLIVLVILIAMLRRRIRVGESLWVIGMLIVFARCGRAAPIFVPLFAAIMSRSLPRLSDRVLGAKWVNLVAAAILLIGIVRIACSLPDNRGVEAWLNRRGPDLPGYPSAAAEFVVANVHRTTGKLINEFDWGGYLAWKLPAYQVFVDGRTQLYTPQFWHDAYLDDPHETTRFLQSIQADTAILPAGKSRFRLSLQELGWKRVYEDERAEVFVPPSTMAETEE